MDRASRSPASPLYVAGNNLNTSSSTATFATISFSVSSSSIFGTYENADESGVPKNSKHFVPLCTLQSMDVVFMAFSSSRLICSFFFEISNSAWSVVFQASVDFSSLFSFSFCTAEKTDKYSKT